MRSEWFYGVQGTGWQWLISTCAMDAMDAMGAMGAMGAMEAMDAKIENLLTIQQLIMIILNWFKMMYCIFHFM